MALEILANLLIGGLVVLTLLGHAVSFCALLMHSAPPPAHENQPENHDSTRDDRNVSWRAALVTHPSWR